MATARQRQDRMNYEQTVQKNKTDRKERSMVKWIKKQYQQIKSDIAYRKKLKQLRKRDPFIYK